MVTGAGRGIGAATVHLLAARGWRVVALDICHDDPELGYPLARPEELAAVREAHPDQVVTVEGDVRRGHDLGFAVALAQDRFGQLDAAVAVAGVQTGGPPVWAMTEAQWRVNFDVNVDGVWRLAVAAVPALLSAPVPRQGRFVAVSSAAGVLGLRRLAAYGASKHAVVGLVRGMAADLAGTGVTANTVCPGSTRTALLEESARLYGMGSGEEFAGQQLVERLLTPEEPAALIAWLCEAESSAVTGAVLAADGGLSVS